MTEIVVGGGYFYTRTRGSYWTDQPYGSGTRKLSRSVKVPAKTEELIATVLEIDGESVLLHVEGGGKEWAKKSDLR